MTDVHIASNTEYIENRQASGVIQFAGGEGTLVTIDSTGDLVQADAADGVAGKARGVLLSAARDPANYGNDFEETRLVVESNYDLVGEDRLAFFEYGVRVRNADEDWGFTPGADIYLAEGGGYTDTAPSTSGSLVQKVGYAKDSGEEIVIHVDQHAEETVA